MSNIVICNTAIRQDSSERFRLNDLHKAAGGEKRHQPSDWLRIQQTKELIEAIENSGNSRSIPVESVEGRNGGTYVVKELVYAYAMWVSPHFHLHVIRTFDQLVQRQREVDEAARARQVARMEAPMLTDAIKTIREVAGKEIHPYHFSNEFDLINRIAIGQTAKQYRRDQGIDQATPIRDHLTPHQIKCIEHLQRANTTMIELGYDFEKRKGELNKLFVLRHKRDLMAEVLRLEA